MLDVLTEGFREAKQKLTGKAVLNEENVADALLTVRRSLLEADVEYGVVKGFLQRVKDKALGAEVQLKAGSGVNRMRVSPADHFVKICNEELVGLMGPTTPELNFPHTRPAVIMMVGLQGSGKTTSTGKLAHYLMHTLKKKPLLVAADIYRPAAVEQLKVLGAKLGAPVFSLADSDPVTICESALKHATDIGCNVVLLDTAGRLTVDEALMQELADIRTATRPDDILLVCDAMMGQDAVTTARAFDARLDLSGSIITKLDGDARGGAALSIKQVTGKPIKFLGMGEGLDKLEEFRPEGLASRILGMGDLLGLMDDFSKVVDEDHEKTAMRMLQGRFNYIDFYKQIEAIQKMGSLKDIAAKLPMQNLIPKDANMDDGELVKIKSIIDSMTQKERIGLSALNPSRVRRIARGAGRKEKDVDELTKKFHAMQKMMNMLGKGMGGMLGKIPGMNAIKQMGNMRNMMGAMKDGSLGSMPGMGDMAALLGGGGPGAAFAPKPVDRDKLKKVRKAAKQARKKNRKK